MASQWFYKRADVRHGPVTTTELRNLASTGGIAPADAVWKEGLAEWLPAGQLNGLFARPSRPPPIPPASVPPPLPPGVGGSEPPPIPAPQSAGMMASAGELARSAVVAGRRAYAAAPDQAAVGRRSVLKR